jgi:protoheme IX farnesyltransferase
MNGASDNSCDFPPARRPSMLRVLLNLTKMRITVAVTLTTATGYFLQRRGIDWSIWQPLLGTFLLACGACALNEWQESHLDAKMKRTRLRPIPAGLIDPSVAVFTAALFVLAGMFILTLNPETQYTLFVLGASALVWYNGLYTYLKRVTAFAVVPGALIGALPPLIGYVAAGGRWNDPRALLLASFFFVWQIPHFWLLLTMVGQQYAEAGLPTLTRTFAPAQLLRITFMWILATALAGLVFPTMTRVNTGLSLPWSLVIVLASIWLASKGAKILSAGKNGDNTAPFRRAFVQINVYALTVMTCLSLSAVGVRLEPG